MKQENKQILIDLIAAAILGLTIILMIK